MEATTPELGPVGFWSSKSSFFSGSDSIVREAARNFRSPRLSIIKSREANTFIQHDKVEAFKLRRYIETCSRALEHKDKHPLMTPLSSYSACRLTDW